MSRYKEAMPLARIPTCRFQDLFLQPHDRHHRWARGGDRKWERGGVSDAVECYALREVTKRKRTTPNTVSKTSNYNPKTIRLKSPSPPATPHAAILQPNPSPQSFKHKHTHVRVEEPRPVVHMVVPTIVATEFVSAWWVRKDAEKETGQKR